MREKVDRPGRRKPIRIELRRWDTLFYQPSPASCSAQRGTDESVAEANARSRLVGQLGGIRHKVVVDPIATGCVAKIESNNRIERAWPGEI